MSKVNKIIQYLIDPDYRVIKNAKLGLYNRLSDEDFIKLLFKAEMGYDPDLENPKTFNEKLQWIKLYDHNPLYTKMVDKIAVKDYVREKIGDEHIIKTLGIWDSYDDIDFETLPEQFVLKCNHDSGGLVIVKDKEKMDRKMVRKTISSSLRINYYKKYREWPYKNVQPRIIAETYVVDEATNSLNDYKFFCFNGKVKCFKIDFNRFVKHQANYYDENCNLLPFGEKDFPRDSSADIKMPPVIDEMKKIAEIIAAGHPFLRVDLYYANNHIYFGEITFFPASGFGKIEPVEWDSILGEWINLEMITKKNGE